MFSGKTILITGASSGIGRAAACMISRSGASVVITGRDRERLEETRRMIEEQAPIGRPFPEKEPGDVTGAAVSGTGSVPPSCTIIAADLTDQGALENLVKELPPLDGLVHCAGIVGPLPVKFITPEDIDRMFAINYRAPVNLTSLILRKKKLADHASVVFMSTIATRNPYFGGALYSGSKAALEAYSRTLALEMTGRRIRSNFIMAGLVDTPMIESPSEEKMQEEALERYLKRYPLGVGKPDDVASAICYFLSDASRWVSGTSLIMGGE